MEPAKCRVAIVGSGPGGLAAAMLLAKTGMKVIVYERKSIPGGRTHVMVAPNPSGEGAFRHDLGPTFFHYPQTLERIFAICGYDLSKEIPLIRLDPMYHLEFEDGKKIHCTPDRDKMREQLKQFPHSTGKEFDHFMEDNRKKFDVFKPLLEKSTENLADIWYTPHILEILRRLRIYLSVDSDLKGYIKDRNERIAFSFQTKYLGMSPDHCPALFTILAFLEYNFGVFHPKGGCGQLTVQMERLARDLGAEFLYNMEVTGIRFGGKDGRTATGLTARDVATGEDVSHEYDAVIVNGDFAYTIPRLVPNSLRKAKWNDEFIETRKYSCSTFMLYLGIEGDYHERLGHHTIWLPNDYDENLKDIEHRHLLRENTAFYVQNPCVTDTESELAPADCSVLYVLVPVTHLYHTVNWEAEKESYAETILNQLEYRLGLKDIRKRIRYQKIMTPEDWESDMAVYRGAVFNLAHNVRQMLHYRPHNRFNHTNRLYLVGGGTHPGSGLPTIFESARISAGHVVHDLGLDEELLRVPDYESKMAKV